MESFFPAGAKKAKLVSRPTARTAKAMAAKKRTALTPAVVESAVEIFKALGDPTRLRILHLLAQGELCVCDLAGALGMSPSAVSHQLRLLRTERLIRSRREGRRIFYALDDDHIERLLAEGLKHASHK